MPGLLIAAAVAGCSQQQKPLLVPPEPPIVWPKPPDAARVRYIGELKSSADLSPAKPFAQVVNELFYGPEAPRALVKPHAVAVHPDGVRVAVADTDAACVHVFDMARRSYRQIGAEAPPGPRLECPTGVAWEGETLWVADAKLHAVVIVRPDGGSRAVGADLLRRPAGIAASRVAPLMYVSDAGAHAVVAFDREGRQALKFGEQGTGPGQFNFPAQVACGPDGTVVVADAMNFRVQRFTPDGSPLGAFGRKGDAPGDFALPKGVAVDAEGNLWVVDGHFENVQAFTPAGELLMAIGREGHEPGEFWLPAGLCIDAQRRIWIADTYNRRIQVFELLS